MHLFQYIHIDGYMYIHGLYKLQIDKYILSKFTWIHNEGHAIYIVRTHLKVTNFSSILRLRIRDRPKHQ